MNITTAEYIGSFQYSKECPKETIPEFAFIGRSNVGKSSLVNMLTNRKGLAKTSSTPGKTQSINFFKINTAWHLVDLPGYGYAKVAKRQRASWGKMIENYLKDRLQLATLFILVDASIPPQAIDIEFINMTGALAIPMVIVFTKTDKENAKLISEHISAFEKKLLDYWETLPKHFSTSSKSQRGRKDILSYIENIILLPSL